MQTLPLLIFLGDESLAAHVLDAYLRAVGFRLVNATNLEEMIQLIAEHPRGVGVIALDRPNAELERLTEKLSERLSHPRTPILVLDGKDGFDPNADNIQVITQPDRLHQTVARLRQFKRAAQEEEMQE